jgi:flagellin
MALSIQTNVASLSAQKNLSKAQLTLGTSFNRLSSGLRINSAKDDAAGLAISESMRMQIRSYGVTERNANDGISMAQTAEGALGEVSNVLGRMRELAVQGASGSIQSTDRGYLQTEFSSLQSEIKRILTSTKFNGVALLRSAASTVDFQVGIDNSASDRITATFGKITLSSVTAGGLGVGIRVSSAATNSQTALAAIDSALTTVSTARARFGAAMNRFEITTSNIQTSRLNLTAATSRIRDVDVAEETATLSRSQVLATAGVSVLAQANSSPQLALGLLR